MLNKFHFLVNLDDIDMNDESKKKGSPYRFGDDSLNKNDLSMFLKSKPN